MTPLIFKLEDIVTFYVRCCNWTLLCKREVRVWEYVICNTLHFYICSAAC